MACKQKEKLQEEFIECNKPYILSCASMHTGRYITTSDDEWSVALQGFVEAIYAYDKDKGRFLPFAKVIMKRRLTDFQRKNSRFSAEYLVSPFLFHGEYEDGEDIKVVHRQLAIHEESDIVLEIQCMNEILKGYGFSFYDLTKCSPKFARTKESCGEVIKVILKNKFLLEDMRKMKRLPLNYISKECHVSCKFLDKYRRYIIAVVEILDGEYLLLQEYTKNLRG